MKVKTKKGKSGLPKTRKELRKAKRKEKKVKKHEYYTNRNKQQPGQFVLSPHGNKQNKVEKEKKTEVKRAENARTQQEEVLSAERIRDKEKKQQAKLQQQMRRQRKKQLLEANVDEDRNIKRLEKQLKLNKRKNKSVPKSFSVDGLDYLLEVCDSESMKSSVLAEQQLLETNEDFGEDLALMTGEIQQEDKKRKRKPEEREQKKKKARIEEDLDEESDFSDLAEEELSGEEESDEFDESLMDESEDEEENEEQTEDEEINDEIGEDNDNEKDNTIIKNKDGTWQDIYGRLRGPDGQLIEEKTAKYIPPAIRAKLESDATSQSDQQRLLKLSRLKKQLKGLLNRLAESNLHNICQQIEKLYMANSRHDMNETLTNLILDALLTPILAPERLLQEHVLLIAILHANVGTEVGAHFLQTCCKLFAQHFEESRAIEAKQLDNVVNIIAQLYNFKLFDSRLIYDLCKKLIGKFEEKDVECILHVLRSIGFSLRKDNPLELKELILILQKKAATSSSEDNPRVKFMLDIVLAIKNNNVTKIPNYDTSHTEHLKKIMKGFIRKGNYVTQLNISLEDLLKAEERGRWWVVGSAWAGNENIKEVNDKIGGDEDNGAFSQHLLELARKQRMNTDTRKNIFCIIMSAEDYLDAFEKLLKLSLKNQQDRDIIHVILHCCLQEKKYNAYYAILAQKFCEYDRKYQMAIKYSIWDKLKALNDHSATQVSNLAKLLTHLLLEKGLPISALKVVEFGELDKLTLRFMRQILIGLLLSDNVDQIQQVFEKVAYSDKLKMFRESLRLFIHHFLLKNLKDSNVISDDKKEMLRERVGIVEKMLQKKRVDKID